MTSPADRLPVMAGVVLLSAVVSAMLLLAPVVVGALISHDGFSPQQAGWTISIELGAMSIAAIPALWWVPVAQWRRLTSAALLVMILGNLLSAFATSFAVLAPLRFTTGFAGGSIMVICLRLIGTSRETERNFGWWTVGQLLLGSAGLALLPRFVPAIGLRGLFFGLSALLALCFLAVRGIPERDAAAATAAVATPSTRQSAGAFAPLALFSILIFYIALSGVWTYVERIGAAAGLPATRIGDDLTLASMCGIAGCISATLVGSRFGRRGPAITGYALMIVSILSLAGAPTPWRYAIAACGFKYAWTFALPFILASTAAHDRNGRLMALANLAIGSGLALGPAMIASLLDARLDYGVALKVGVAGAALSLVLLLLSLQTQDRPRAQRAQADK